MRNVFIIYLVKCNKQNTVKPLSQILFLILRFENNDVNNKVIFHRSLLKYEIKFNLELCWVDNKNRHFE